MMMTPGQFRIVLAVLVMLLLAHVSYSAPRSKQSREAEDDREFGWLRSLPRHRLHAFIALAVASIAAGVVGIAGMFLLYAWAPYAFLAGVVVIEGGSYVMFKRSTKTLLEKVLARSVLVGEIAVLYLVLGGPARHLFENAA